MDLMGFSRQMFSCSGSIILPPQSSRRFRRVLQGGIFLPTESEDCWWKKITVTVPPLLWPPLVEKLPCVATAKSDENREELPLLGHPESSHLTCTRRRSRGGVAVTSPN